MGSLTGLNVGIVVYTKGDVPGSLDGRWSFENSWDGPGRATGGPEQGFAGKYHIRYFFENGEFSDEYDLIIEKAGNYYEVSWLADGNVRAVGLGVELEGALVVGWRKLE